MTIADFETKSPGKHLTTIVRRVSGSIKVARDGVASLVAHAPRIVDATRSGARATTRALQTLPDATLRPLAASSIGLGAGLYVSGKRRLAFVAGVAPAVAMAAAVVMRPAKPAAPAEPTS
jgi:hypothetical protein